jgi:hypothetical protein
MTYVTSIERLAKEEGLTLAIIVVLSERFREIDGDLKSRIDAVRDRNLLQVLFRGASRSPNLMTP